MQAHSAQSRICLVLALLLAQGALGVVRTVAELDGHSLPHTHMPPSCILPMSNANIFIAGISFFESRS